MWAKKTLSILIAFTLALAAQVWQAQPAAAADLPDIIVASAVVTPANLSQGTDFTLQLSYKNVSSSDITNVLLDFSDAVDVIVPGGGSTVSLADVGHGVTAGPASISLKYVGSAGNDRIQINFMYSKAGVAAETTTYFYVNASATSTTTPSQPDTSKFKPMIQLTVLGSKSVNAGDSTDITLQIQNVSSLYPAYNISLESAAAADSPFTSVMFTPSALIPVIMPGNSVVVRMTVNTDKFAANGDNVLPVHLSFANSWSDQATSDAKVVLSIVNPNTPGRIALVNSSTIPAQVKAGSGFAITFVISNNGTLPVEDIRVTLDSLSPDTFALTSGSNCIMLDSLDGRNGATVTLNMRAGALMKTGSYPLSFKIDYSDEKGTKTTGDAQQLWIPINGLDAAAAPVDDSKNVPRIIIRSYSLDPSLIKAGSQFKLGLEFMNTHISKTISNIKATFTVADSSSDTGNVFTPVGSSNTFYIDSIAPKKSVKRDITLYTIPDAKSKTYTVTFSFEYQDASGNPYKSDEIIGVPVSQPARFEIGEPAIPAGVQAGQPAYISFDMYNLGKDTLNNVKMQIEGIDSQPKSAYYGNFEPGHDEFVELNVTPQETGDVTGNIVVSYETPSGEVNQTVKEFTLNVAELPINMGGEGIVGPDGKVISGSGDGKGQLIGPDGNPISTGGTGAGFFQGVVFKVIAAVVGLAVILMITLFFVRRSKKEKGIEF